MAIVKINTSISTSRGGSTGSSSGMGNHCCILGKKNTDSAVVPQMTTYEGETRTSDVKWCGGRGGAIADQGLNSNGCLEFKIEGEQMMIGFTSNQNSANNWTRLDFSIYLINGQVYAYGRPNPSTGGSAGQGTIGTYNNGDDFKICVEGGNVKVYKSGVLLHTFTNQVNNIQLPLFPAFYAFRENVCAVEPMLTIS